VGLFDRWTGSVVRRRRDGDFDVTLGEHERALLGQLIGQLRELLSTDSAALARLFPPPYGDDEERNQGYAALAGSELVERRLAALDVVGSTLEETVLSQEQLEAWMRSINDVRLVLGTILDVDDSHVPPPADSDELPMYAAYEYFGMVLEHIVRALSSD
jgi:hypothetical protein